MIHAARCAALDTAVDVRGMSAGMIGNSASAESHDFSPKLESIRDRQRHVASRR